MGHIGTDLSYYLHSLTYFRVSLRMKTSLLVISVENHLIVRSPSERSISLRIKFVNEYKEEIPRHFKSNAGFPVVLNNQSTTVKATPTDTY